MTVKILTNMFNLPCLIIRLALPILFLSALPTYATTYYLQATGEFSNDASKWKDVDGNASGENGVSLSAEHDYVVRGFATNLTAKGVCYAKSMSIGENEIGGRLYMNTGSFNNDGLFLVKGSMRSANINSCYLRGKITVTAPYDAPFGIWGYTGINRTFYLNSTHSTVPAGSLYGDSTAALAVGMSFDLQKGVYVVDGSEGYQVRFYQLENYYGLISVTSKYDNASCVGGYGAAIALYDSKGKVPGSLRICGCGGLLLSSAADQYTVSELTLEPGSMIRTVVDLENNKCVQLKPSKLTVNGPVCVMASYDHKVSADGKEIRLALMTAPQGVTLNANDFFFRPDSSQTDDNDKNYFQQRAHLEVVTEGDVDTLYLVIDPIIKLLSGDSANLLTVDSDPAMEKPESWQDGSVPVGGRHYHLNSEYLQFIGDSDYTFPGKSLIHDGGRTLFSGKRDIVFSNYVWRSGIIYSMKDADIVLKGKMLISAVADATSPRSLRSFGYPIEINADIYGAGDMLINNSGESPYQAIVTLSGDNSGYSGKIAVSNIYSTVNYKNRWTYLHVSNANSLGGTLDAFEFDALSLSRLARLIPTETMTLSKTSNRGLFVIGEGVIAPNDGVTLRMEWPITMNGTLRKNGLGVLEMAGEIRFYDAENKTSVETPRAEADVLELREGTLKIASTNACNGLNITVYDGTSILLPKPGTDTDLDKYGLYNVKAGAAPFTFAKGVTQLPIAFEEQLSADSLEGTVTNALCTVANSAVESVRSMLPNGIHPYQGGIASIVEIPRVNENATTFACVSKRHGFIFSIR